MADPVDPTPLLGDSSSGSSNKAAISECKLQDKCFLSEGAAHGSSEGYQKVQRKLVAACILCFIFMTVEVVGGYIAKSVAIMSDAAHMLSDVSAFLVSIFATWAATQPSTWHYSFGYHRAEILGALISVLTIWAVTGALVFEAFQRTINPVRVDGKLMFIISVAGVVFNILIALTLGVHAHLGHSHGPGGCSHGHSHSHDHDHDHDHEHSEHGHTHGACNLTHDHSRSKGSKHGSSHGECSSSGAKAHAHKHSSSQSSSKEQPSGGCCGHKHEENVNHHHQQQHQQAAHMNGKQPCCHGHSHSNGSSLDSHADSEQEAAHEHAPDHSHTDHDHTHNTHSQEQQAAVAGPPAAAAGTPSVVIDVPVSAVVGGSGNACGLNGHALSCRCTISKTGSREIEVRCELPVPVAGAAAAAAGGSSGARQHSHSNGGHGPSHGGDPGSINLRGAVLHVIGDLLQSVGVAIAGGLIWMHQDDPRWYLADPICTFVFSIVVLLTTKSILRDIVHVLMERTPPNMDVPAVARVMRGVEGVWDIHDLHIWNISTSMKPVLTAHVHIGPEADANVVLQQLEAYVRGLGIDHSTIQICNIQLQPEQPAEV